MPKATGPHPHALLGIAEMARADALAVAAGVSGEALMEAAGWAVAQEIRRRWALRPTAVLCGPGNNGGDGFVAARLLAAAGWPVKVALLGSVDDLKGEAAVNAARWEGAIEPLDPIILDSDPLVVDALFGAGLTRPLAGQARVVVDELTRRGLDCVAIDVPSGVGGDSGAMIGKSAVHARLTVTFFRKKPGHLLLPGRLLAGEVVVADIGIPASVLAEIAPMTHENDPGLWLHLLPRPQIAGHKYDRGHALIVGGGAMTGAARLAARAARRVGAGLVTIAAPAEALAVYRAGDPGNIVVGSDEFDALIADKRRNAVLLGPGNGIGPATRDRVAAALKARKACVLDADALTSFADDPAALWGLIRGACLITPHDGEFARLFACPGDRLARARAAAAIANSVVLLKGADTVIAAPDGRAAVNTNGPPDLATAGTGDVLAGLAVGLLAQGMAPFDAACAAAWLHGRAAASIGRGLIAEDLPDVLPSVLNALGT